MKKYIPNILTVSRIVLTLLLFLTIMKLEPGDSAGFIECLIFFIVISATDFLDGFLARRWQVESQFGRVIDPLADKIFIVGAFICFTLRSLPEISILSPIAQDVVRWTLTGIIIVRELSVTMVRQVAETKGHNFAASKFGKVKMFSQCIAGAYVLLHSALMAGSKLSAIVILAVYFVTAFATAGSGIEAAVRLYKAEKAHKLIID
ncbi:MAG: CDP-diacylglycerol--glycerol-3-phosphate 3-phosphatidyltransferase [Phycisphaerae bacterium]|jgi:CDP-diacylglycerol--glycerol-3-phosphate 3-phosphatidyltransferase